MNFAIFIHLVSEFVQLHNGSKFSTYDHDVDNDKRNCAERFRGGWWYNTCSQDSLYSNIQFMILMIRRKP